MTKPGKQKKEVLADHARRGKRFVPPFVQTLGPIQEVKWIDRPLPELLWLALLNHRHGFARGAELALAVAKAGAAVLTSNARLRLALTSAYGTLTLEQRQRMVSELSTNGFLEDIQSALGDFVALYPDCPLAFLCNGTPTAGARADRIAEIKTIFSELFDKTSTAAVRMQANAVYLTFVAGGHKVPSSTSLANLPAVELYPNTEESQKVGAAVRSTVLMFFHQSDKDAWPEYFWNRGLEIDACAFVTEDGDE